MSTRLKFILTYIGGIVTGIVIVFIWGYCMAKSYVNNASDGIDMYDKPTQTIDINAFEVMQVLSDGSALATSEDIGDIGVIVLFKANDGESYYDQQKITIPSDKCLKQIGTYRYTSRQDIEKTVPIVAIFDK